MITTTTNYIGGLVYQSKATVPAEATDHTDQLQHIMHEEGRTRFVAAVDNNPGSFEHDYFVKDHLGNVRMVLTEERKTDIYQATMEPAIRNFEVALFGNKVESTAQTKDPDFDADKPSPLFQNY
ncbi:hypothetical protein [Niastella populi]|uniref:Uncharacterized protein n=1 Tax=Niastella populi TaxID=550983 RepID=A0A1V9F5F1_9BACT|nr:hypothetical protein [Niastella populi]OQP53640.1 hypothetical protein A4R26_06630 [Niastella populi]